MAHYSETPLVPLDGLALELGAGRLMVKDESYRFGLNAFKALGSAYAMYKFITRQLSGGSSADKRAGQFYLNPPIEPGEFTFCTATDGNHGRGVAWVARLLKQKAIIYLPEETAPSRIENIKAEGAEVIAVSGSYDSAVDRCREDAERNGWSIIADTGWTGYEQIPRWIQAGYLTMFEEVQRQWSERPDVVFIQSGVGALAATAAWYYHRAYPEPPPKLICVEPLTADCCLQSIKSEEGEPMTIDDNPSSIMAGLNCGTPSPVAWPFIKQGYAMFAAITDRAGREAMRTFYHPKGGDPRIVSGESGAAGLAALMTIMSDPAFKDAREFLKLDKDSRVLLINTEGDTDPEGFRVIVG